MAEEETKVRMTFDSLPPPPRLSSRNSPNSGTRHRPQENVKPARKRKNEVSNKHLARSKVWHVNENRKCSLKMQIRIRIFKPNMKKARFSKYQRSIVTGALKHYENQPRSVERLQSSSLRHYSVLQRMNTMTLQWIRPHSFRPLKKRAQYLSRPRSRDGGGECSI